MSRMLRAWFLVFAAVVFVHLGGVANLAQQRDSDPELPENKIPENAKAILEQSDQFPARQKRLVMAAVLLVSPPNSRGHMAV